jgi:hypothetical protein
LAATAESVASREAIVAPERVGEGGVEKLTQNRHREIAVGLLDQQQMTIGALASQIGERILVAPLPLHLARIGVERARLTYEVEAHIGERHVLFEHRRMAAPFRQAMAEDQRVVGAAQQIGEQGHHMCPTSSGTS